MREKNINSNNNKNKKKEIKTTTNVYLICDISQHVSFPAIYIVSQSVSQSTATTTTTTAAMLKKYSSIKNNNKTHTPTYERSCKPHTMGQRF